MHIYDKQKKKTLIVASALISIIDPKAIVDIYNFSFFPLAILCFGFLFVLPQPGPHIWGILLVK